MGAKKINNDILKDAGINLLGKKIKKNEFHNLQVQKLL